MCASNALAHFAAAQLMLIHPSMKAILKSAAMLGLLGASSTSYAAEVSQQSGTLASAGTGPAVAAGVLFAALLMRSKKD